MNGKKAKLLRLKIKKSNPNTVKSLYNTSLLEDTPEEKTTIYLTVDCWRFYYKKLKNTFKKLNHIAKGKL